jgi:recombination protein RecT
MANNALATVDNLLQNANVRKRFTDVFGNVNAANNFMQSMVSLTNGNAMLRRCNPQSILSACMVAATLKLPINPSLGFAYVVPYGNVGQLQVGWRGFVQLAMRTGQYQRINVADVHEGEIESIDFVTGDIVRGEKKSDKVVGYIAYFRLVNGFEKSLYMSVEEVKEHAAKFSKTYRNKQGVWHTNFNRMAEKTVLKLLISRFGIMSTDMQSADLDLALRADQAVIKNSETMEMEYVDNQPDDVADADTSDSSQEDAGEPIEVNAMPSTPSADKADDDAILEAALDEG